MNRKFVALLAVSVLVLNTVVFAAADTRSNKAKLAQANALVALLPASDGIAVLDSKRFFADALPSLLAANQPVLSGIMEKLEEMKARTGFDLRQFEHIAVGVTIKQVSATEVDTDPVAIARGSFPAGGLVSLAKMGSNGKYREEKIGNRTVYIFDAKEIAAKHAPKPGSTKVAGAIDRTISGLAKEIAVTAIDSNTLAIGSPLRVRQTLESPARGDAELTTLLSKKPGAIMSFAARTPEGLGKHLPVDNDELGNSVNGIRFVYGSLDVAAGNAVLQGMARTQQPAQAQNLLETLQGLQLIGKAFLGGSKGPDKDVYGRMIDNAKFARSGSDVTLDLSIPQSDLDILVAGIKITTK